MKNRHQKLAASRALTSSKSRSVCLCSLLILDQLSSQAPSSTTWSSGSPFSAPQTNGSNSGLIILWDSLTLDGRGNPLLLLVSCDIPLKLLIKSKEYRAIFSKLQFFHKFCTSEFHTISL